MISFVPIVSYTLTSQSEMSVRNCRQLPFITIKLVLTIVVIVLGYFIIIHHTGHKSISLGSKQLQSLPMFNLSDSLPNVQLLLSPTFCSGEIIDILSVVHSAVEKLQQETLSELVGDLQNMIMG